MVLYIFSPISDLNPIFMASGCELEIGDINGVRKVKLIFVYKLYHSLPDPV